MWVCMFVWAEGAWETPLSNKVAMAQLEVLFWVRDRPMVPFSLCMWWQYLQRHIAA